MTQRLDTEPPSAEVARSRRELLAGGLAVAALPMTPAAASAQDRRIASAAGPAVTRLPTRRLGGLDASALGMGVMNIVHAYGPPIDRGATLRLVRHAYDRGVTFFDTAEVYGPFVAEEIAGEALAPVRDDVTICSKFGF